MYNEESGTEFSEFREAYSTYKGEALEEMPIMANQVLASSSPMAAAKLLVLSEEKQQEYCNKILKPLLINFYLATSKNKKEARERASNALRGKETISDIIRLVQDEIVLPVEERLG